MPGAPVRRVAILFPGQGAISAGAGRAWADHPAWSVLEQVEAAARRPVAPLLLDATDDALARTDAAQLATLALSLVAWEAARPAIEREGFEVVAFAGHSLGQVTALLASGTLPFDAGVAFAAARAHATAAADDASPGRLAALLGATLEQAAAACDGVDDCWVANDNAPGQVVIGGSPDGLAAASEAARALGVRKVMPLAVGGAFHTPLLQPAADALAGILATAPFAAPTAPVVDNTDARPRTEPSEWPELLRRHLVEPVRWREVQEVLVGELGATHLVELAPAGTLTAMARRTVPDAEVLALDTLVGVAV
jgi:[acyl-carrier-protein] S-malonyltransferase